MYNCQKAQPTIDDLHQSEVNHLTHVTIPGANTAGARATLTYSIRSIAMSCISGTNFVYRKEAAALAVTQMVRRTTTEPYQETKNLRAHLPCEFLLLRPRQWATPHGNAARKQHPRREDNT